MKKILLISGHRPGVNACTRLNVNEGDLNVQLTRLVAARLSGYAEVVVYPYLRDYYRDNLNGRIASKYNMSNFDYVFEIHFNAYDGTTVGTNVQLHLKYTGGVTVEQAIADNLAARIGFRKRGVNGINRRDDLLNMNTAFRKGVDYALLETCFYDNVSDLLKYRKSPEKVASAISDGIIAKFGLKKTVKIVNCETLNYRKSPNGAILGHYNSGDKIVVYETQPDSDGDLWYRTDKGYIWPAYTEG